MNVIIIKDRGIYELICAQECIGAMDKLSSKLRKK